MGTRLRRHRPRDGYEAPRREAQGRGDGRHPGRRPRRRRADVRAPVGPNSRPPGAEAGGRARAEGLCRGAPETRRLARPRLPPLGLGAVRLLRHGRHGSAARRRRGDRARPRQDQGPCGHVGRDAALLPRRSHRGRQTGRRRKLAKPLSRWRYPFGLYGQHELRKPAAARNHGSVRRRRGGSARSGITLEYPVVSGNCSLYNETNGQGILPTPRSAESASCRMFAGRRQFPSRTTAM